ncbi:MAG: Arc family DNA-binding protein, partial [Actinobacteria bacterium]|nr:Arc family DNA-binding protein [Actinomycetota bacterium]
MAAVSIRDLDDSVREKLRVRAAQHGRSMEAEMRAILTAAVSDDDSARGLCQRTRQTPRWWPVGFPAGGQENSPLTDSGSPRGWAGPITHSGSGEE